MTLIAFLWELLAYAAFAHGALWFTTVDKFIISSLTACFFMLISIKTKADAIYEKTKNSG